MRGRGSEGDNPYTYKSVSWKRVIIIITTTTKHKLIKKYIYIIETFQSKIFALLLLQPITMYRNLIPSRKLPVQSHY